MYKLFRHLSVANTLYCVNIAAVKLMHTLCICGASIHQTVHADMIACHNNCKQKICCKPKKASCWRHYFISAKLTLYTVIPFFEWLYTLLVLTISTYLHFQSKHTLIIPHLWDLDMISLNNLTHIAYMYL